MKTSVLRILFRDRLLEVHIRRSSTARLTVRLRRNGTFSATVPYGLPLHQVEMFFQENAAWVRRSLEKLQRLREAQPPAPFRLEDGAGLPVFEKRFRLRVRLSPEAESASFLERNGVLLVTMPRQARHVLCQVLLNWYREKAGAFVLPRVKELAERMGVYPGRIRIKNQRSLWGSCSRQGNLNFNWRIVLLSRPAADYLIVHELAHLVHPNHSEKFWKLVTAYHPDVKAAKRELRAKGSWLLYPGCSDGRTDKL